MSPEPAVSRGFVPQEKPTPSPDMSFVRLFADTSVGWQQRGQYAIWTGASGGGRANYRLLERLGNRVAPVEYPDGRPVFHRIGAHVAFTVENLMGVWLAFDSDAMWLDVPAPSGRYALLAVGGAAGKPGRAVVDWTCPRCGAGMSPREFSIAPLGFSNFLKQVDARAMEFENRAELRTCGNCGAVHPPGTGLPIGPSENPTAAQAAQP